MAQAMPDNEALAQPHAQAAEDARVAEARADDLDRRIVLATQGGLPLVARPYAVVAETLGVPEALVRARLAAMLTDGRIRRIGAVPNHYAIGYTANGMSVWDIDDVVIDAVGERVGALEFVTHCYRRPRHLPDWPYNLFAMVHAASREAALERVEEIAALMAAEFPGACRARDVLFSSGILKKTGLRIGG
jgi:DNA-binding Lrp family transcriptional regulator